MTYRKFKADYLFTGREMADRDAVLITTEDGTIQDILPISEAGEDIRHVKGILSPGFINCHCHLELSHLKGVLPERTGLVDFLLSVMQQRNSGPSGSAAGPTGSAVPGTHIRASSGSSQQSASTEPATPPFIQAAIAEAEAYMLADGIVAVGDICNTTHTLAQKTAGRLYYHNFIETMGFIEQTAPDRFENSRKIFDAFVAAATKKNTSLVPHAPYSVSSRLFGLIAGFPDNHLLTIHNQETAAENEFYLTGKGDFLRLYQAMGLDTSFFKGTGKRSLESYLPYFYRYHGQEPTAPPGSKDNSGSKDDRLPSATTANGHFPPDTLHSKDRRSMILVHNVATSEEDLQFALKGLSADGQRSPDLFFCLCPNANLYIGGELPDITLMIHMNSAIVVGTDSLASNHQLSILEELKTLQRQLPQLPTLTLLRWATANGAEALQMDHLLGSFDPGKRPGVLLIEHMEGDKFKADTQVRRLI